MTDFDNMTPEQVLEELRALPTEERTAYTEGMTPRQMMELLPEVETSVRHEGAGIEVSISPIDGTIAIYAYGNPYDGDPMVQTTTEFSPQEGKIFHSSKFEITPEGEINQNEKEASYDVSLTEGAENPDVTASDVDVPHVNSSTEEVGISTITSEDGLLQVTVHDRGRISQGAIEVQYTDPENGEITMLSADENTVTISKLDTDGGVTSSGPVEMTESFSDNDFRHQPALDMGMNGPG